MFNLKRWLALLAIGAMGIAWGIASFAETAKASVSHVIDIDHLKREDVTNTAPKFHLETNPSVTKAHHASVRFVGGYHRKLSNGTGNIAKYGNVYHCEGKQKIVFSYVGTYKGVGDVGAIVEVFDMVSMKFFNCGDTLGAGFALVGNGSGNHGPELDFKITLVKANTQQSIGTIDNSYITFGSLNAYERNKSTYKNSKYSEWFGAFGSRVYIAQKDGKQDVVDFPSHAGVVARKVNGKDPIKWDDDPAKPNNNFVYSGGTVDFYNGMSFALGTYNMNTTWMSPLSVPIKTYVAAPKKTVDCKDGDKPGWHNANGGYVDEGQEVAFMLEEKMPQFWDNILKAYNQVKFWDNIDKAFEVTSIGVDGCSSANYKNSLSNGTGTVSAKDWKAKVTKNRDGSSYVEIDMKNLNQKGFYNGRSFKAHINTKVRQGAEPRKHENIGHVTVNGYDQSTNKVEVGIRKPKRRLTVRHLDARTGKALASPTTTIKYYGDSYTTSPVAIRGFHVSTYPNNATGTIGAANVVVTYYYDRDRETVKANYKARTDSDKTKQEYGQTLADSVLTSGLYGDPYTTLAKTIAGWHLFETPRNATGNFTVDTPDVNYLYDRDTEVVRVSYVDTHGKTLAPTQTMVGLYGLPYKTEAANVSNYHLTAIPYNANGSYSTSPIDVKYVYDTNPSIQEGLSNSAVSDSNYSSILKTTSLKSQYSNTYHYVSKVNVGGSLTLDALNVSTTLTPGINPITKGKTINDQGIKVYEVGSHDKLQDVTNQGSLTYTVHGANVRSNNSANVAIDLDKSRVVSWTATTPRDFVGKTIYLDIPVTIPPDRSKLTSYRTGSGISLLNSTKLIEKNDVSRSSMYRESTTSNKTLSSNSVETTLPNIYTAKVYKSIFNTASTINGTVYVKVYPNLVGKASGTVSNAVSVVSNGQTRLVDVPLSSKSAIVNATIRSSKAANNKTFDVKLNSNRTSSGTSDLILTKSLIRSETSSNNVTTTTYNPDSSMYSSTTRASQYAPNKATGTDASGVESVETYYKQNADNSQLAASNEMQPLYVKLMEYMHSNHKSSVSAKAGYGIKNDVTLNYYGRHLNIPCFDDYDLSPTFSTAKDLTSANGKSTSERNNPQSELMDYDLSRELASQLRSAVNSSSDKTATLNKYFKSGAASIIASNPINSDYMLDQASTDVSLPTPFANLSREQRDYVESVDKETHTSPTTPKLYTLAYKFNKRLLNNGIEYYDTSSSHVANNNLKNKKSPSRSAHNGGYLFYTNQWLALGNYATTYQSHPFGSNGFVFKLNRNLNIYAHRYLAKGDGATGDEYDDIAIQPVISTDLNSLNATLPSNVKWEDR